MTSETRSKINLLLRGWPQGTVAVSGWLAQRGAYQQLLHEYEKSGWIRRIGQGAYVRDSDKVEWPGGLYALQEQVGIPVHAGAKSALALQGYAHYLPRGKGSAVSLFGLPGQRLPAWFCQYDWGQTINYSATNLFQKDADMGLTKKEMGAYSIILSTPERAIMETLYLVPIKQSFEEATQLMDGLTTLRARLVQKLLEQCQSIKVKRLFMYFAESSQHGWVKKLDTARIDFGKGKRMIVKGGRLNTKYKITVPHSVFE